MKTFLFGQNLKANADAPELNQSLNFPLADRYDENNCYYEKIQKSPYQQNLKKQYQLFNKKLESPERNNFSGLVNKVQSSFEDNIVKISNYPERCYINRIVEYKIPNRLKNTSTNGSNNLRSYEINNHDENDGDTLIVRQKSYLRLTPDNLFPKSSQKSNDRLNDSSFQLPQIKKSTIECKYLISLFKEYQSYPPLLNINQLDSEGDLLGKKQCKLEKTPVNDYQAIKRIIRKNNNFNEKIIQQLNLKYLQKSQQSRSISPLINENINIRNQQYTSLSKYQSKQNKANLNNSYNFMTINTADDNYRTPIRQNRLKTHQCNQSVHFDNADLHKSVSMKKYLNIEVSKPNHHYLTPININRDLIKINR